MSEVDRPSWYVIDENDWVMVAALKGQKLERKLKDIAVDFGDVLIDRWLYDAVGEAYYRAFERDWLELGELTTVNQTRCFEYLDCQRMIRQFNDLKKQWYLPDEPASFAAKFQMARNAQLQRPAPGSDQEKRMLYNCASSMQQWLTDVIPSCVGVLLKG